MERDEDYCRPCMHPSSDGTGNPDEWECSVCGEVYRVVRDLNGPNFAYGRDPVTGERDDYRFRKETVRPGRSGRAEEGR